MRNVLKIIPAFGILAFIMFYDFQGKEFFIKAIIVIFFLLLLINMYMRKSLKFKNYFTSKYNILTSKYRYYKNFDLPEELLFDKINEVVTQSNYKISDINKNRRQILLATGFSMFSWGENIYIEIVVVDNKTVLKLCSVTFFQVFSWGNNRENIKKLLSDIESSFII